MVAQKLDLLAGRDVQHMNPLAGLTCGLHQALRRDHRGGLVAPHRMRARIVLDAKALALVQPRLVLGMKRRAAPYDTQHIAQALLVLQQQGCRSTTP